MASDWNDLFVRRDLSDTEPGLPPSGFGSPDIVCAGTTLVDPSTLSTPASYAAYYNVPLQAGVPNYLYVRAMNASPDSSSTGIASLAMADPDLLLWPGDSSWTRLKTVLGSDTGMLSPTQVSAGSVGVTSDPFVIIPVTSGNYSFVTWLSTEDHPMPILPTIDAAADLARFLMANPAYAYKSIAAVQATTSSSSQQAAFSSGDVAAEWVFGVEVENCEGFQVSLSATTSLPDGTYITLPSTTVTGNSRILLAVSPVQIPANWSSLFVCTYNPQGNTPTSFAVFLVAYLAPPSEGRPNNPIQLGASGVMCGG